MKNNLPTLSIVMPALNEELAILSSVKAVQEVVDQLGINYELILIDDGSTDSTGSIMENLSKTNQSDDIKIIHNTKPRNIGGAFWQGVQESAGKYVMMVPGDNETSRQALINVISKINQFDLIISYSTNLEVRPWSRRIIACSYVIFLNTLFRLNLRYFNGLCLIRRELLQQLPPWTPGFAFMSEILIQLIKEDATYTEVPMPLQPRLGGQSKLFSFKNVFLVIGTINKLIRRVYFTKKNKI